MSIASARKKRLGGKEGFRITVLTIITSIAIITTSTIITSVSIPQFTKSSRVIRQNLDRTSASLNLIQVRDCMECGE